MPMPQHLADLLKSITQQPQRQAATNDQLADLAAFAVRLPSYAEATSSTNYGKMMMKTMLIAFVALVSCPVFAEHEDGRYNYTFPTGQATPFEEWNTRHAITRPEDKDAAEFGATFASKMMTIVQSVEDTKTGKRAFVIVGNQRCLVDMVQHEGKYRATSTKCSTKPFGKF